MNVENIDKLITFIRNRTEKTEDYSDWDQCVSGMAERAIRGELGYPSQMSLAIRLDVDFEVARGIAFMRDQDELYGNYSSRRYDMETFNAMTLEEQNAVLITMLEGVLVNDVPDWSRMPKRPWIKRNAMGVSLGILFGISVAAGAGITIALFG